MTFFKRDNAKTVIFGTLKLILNALFWSQWFKSKQNLVIIIIP